MNGFKHLKGVACNLQPRLMDLSKAIQRDCKASNSGRLFLGEILSTWYGHVGYTYTGNSHPAQPFSKGFEALARKVEKLSDVPQGYFNSALMNIIPKGKGIGAHADDESIFQLTHEEWVDDETCISVDTFGAVATISLGADALITISENATNNSKDYLIKSGDIYIMPEGNFQALYKHKVGLAIDKNRMSLTFRHTN